MVGFGSGPWRVMQFDGRMKWLNVTSTKEVEGLTIPAGYVVSGPKSNGAIVTVRLERAATVSGRVRFTDQPNPARGVIRFFVRRDFGPPTHSKWIDADEKFDWNSSRPGQYVVVGRLARHSDSGVATRWLTDPVSLRVASGGRHSLSLVAREATSVTPKVSSSHFDSRVRARHDSVGELIAFPRILLVPLGHITFYHLDTGREIRLEAKAGHWLTVDFDALSKPR